MGLFSFIKSLVRFVFMRGIQLLFLAALVLFIPSLPPWGEYTPFNVTTNQPLTGPLAVNNRLAKVEKLFEGKVHGPEAYADFNGKLYTGVHGGKILLITETDLVPIADFSTKECEGFHTEHLCGRPLGMQFSSSGELIVADAYSGIWSVDVNSGKKKLLVSIDTEIGGHKSKLPNGVTVAKNGDVYWSDSSHEYLLRDGIYICLADATGRLLKHTRATGANEVLVEKLHFANGVSLSENEEFVLVNDLMKSRIVRYYLKGNKKGQSDVFIDGLPGLPDNLCSDKAGGFLVPLIGAVDESNPSLVQIFGPFPLIRKLAARILGIIDYSFEAINRVYPNYYTQVASQYIGHLEPLSRLLMPTRVMIVHLDKDGNILENLSTESGLISGIAEAHIFNNYLWLGSPFTDHIARIKLDYVNLKNVKSQKSTAQKPVSTIEKPTTTTQKPTTTTTQRPTTTTTQRPTTTTQKPTTTTQKPTTTTQKATTTTTQKPTTTTQRPTTTTSKPKTTAPKQNSASNERTSKDMKN